MEKISWSYEARGPCTKIVAKPHRNPKVRWRSLIDYVGGFQNSHKVTFLPYKVCRGPMDLVVVL